MAQAIIDGTPTPIKVVYIGQLFSVWEVNGGESYSIYSPRVSVDINVTTPESDVLSSDIDWVDQQHLSAEVFEKKWDDIIKECVET